MTTQTPVRRARTTSPVLGELVRDLTHRHGREFERAQQLDLELRRLRESRLFRVCFWLQSLWRRLRPCRPESVPPPGPGRGQVLDIAASPVTGQVSIVIPFRDRVELLHNCLISLRHSSYRHGEVVLVDNGSREPVTQRYLDRLSGRRRVTILSEPGEFNFARLCNRGADQAGGEWLLFLNNDVEVISPDWLEQLLLVADQPSVGVVGATLLYPSGKLQHAGMFPLPDGRWEHSYRGFPADHRGAEGELTRARSVLAVTGACLLMRRELFRAVGGFDERLPVTHNDTDLCRRVRERGLLVAVTPQARLYHLESASRGAYSV